MKHLVWIACVIAALGCNKKNDTADKPAEPAKPAEPVKAEPAPPAPPVDDGSAWIGLMTKWKDEMCACKDHACGEKVDQEMLDVTSSGKAPKTIMSTDELKAKLDAVTADFNKCRIDAYKPK